MFSCTLPGFCLQWFKKIIIIQRWSLNFLTTKCQKGLQLPTAKRHSRVFQWFASNKSVCGGIVWQWKRGLVGEIPLRSTLALGDNFSLVCAFWWRYLVFTSVGWVFDFVDNHGYWFFKILKSKKPVARIACHRTCACIWTLFNIFLISEANWAIFVSLDVQTRGLQMFFWAPEAKEKTQGRGCWVIVCFNFFAKK